MEKVTNLISYIAPSIRFPGRQALSLAIECARLLLAEHSPDDIQMTKDIYPVVAEQIAKSLQTTERTIYRAVEACWMNGNNNALHQIIGRSLPTKPKPSEFILYCAYYVTYDAPYYLAATDLSPPMLF